ncbi:MAG: hypothetical protein ACJ8J0_15885 [Longimicrobiaceae bacterium]
MNRRFSGCRARAPWLQPNRAAMVFAAAVALLSGCGRDEAATPPRDSTPERSAARAETPPPLPRATRFSPVVHAADPKDGSAPGVPAALSGFCQLARRLPDPDAVRVDTLAMPRSPRSLVGLTGESSSSAALRCVVRNQEEWDLARSKVILSNPVIDARPVDFHREMIVIANAVWTRLFAQVWIDGSWSRGDTLVVAVAHVGMDGPPDEVDPGDGSPSVVVAVPRVRGPVFFIEH